MDIKLIKKGDYFILQRGGEVVKVCGCCGKQLDAKAAATLLAKLHAGELAWQLVYDVGISAEFMGKEK